MYSTLLSSLWNFSATLMQDYVHRQKPIICQRMDGCCYNLHVSVTDRTRGQSRVEALTHKLQKCFAEGNVFSGIVLMVLV